MAKRTLLALLSLLLVALPAHGQESQGFFFWQAQQVSATYSGKALGFASGAYLQASAPSTIPFAPGRTLWLVFQTLGTTNSTWEDVLSSTDGGSFGAAKGFWLARGGADSGANAGYLTMIAGTSVRYFYSPPSAGVTVLALVWRASDNSLLSAANGGPLTVFGGGALAPVAQDSTCRGRLGAPNAFAQALSTARLLAYAVWPTEASATQATQGTYTTGSRYALPASVRSAAVQEWQASRDYASGASSSTTQGSSPITFAATGAPALTNVAEQRFAATSYWDSSSAVQQTDGSGVSYTIRLPYARLRYTSDAQTVAVEGYSTILSLNPQAETGVYSAGAWKSEQVAPQNGYPYLTEVALGGGAGKAVDVWDGPQVYGSYAGGTRFGTFVQAVRFPLLALDGSAVAPTAVRARAAVQKRLVVFGDSIWVGFYALPMTESGLPALLRADFPTTGTGGVTCLSAGFESVYDLASTPTVAAATAAALVAEMDGSNANFVVTNLGTNDYGGLNLSAAQFTAVATDLLSAIHTAVTNAGTPGFQMVWVTPIQRIAPSTEAANPGGATLGDIRAAISALTSTFPWLAVVNGAAGAIVSNANMYSDGVHVTAPGDVQLHAAVKAAFAGY